MNARSVTAFLGLVAAGCGAAMPAPAVIAAPTAAVNLPGHLPLGCDAIRPREGGMGGVLGWAFAIRLYDESAPHVVGAACDCAREHGVYAPGIVRVSTVLVPGRGQIEGADAITEGGARDSDDWSGFEDCLARTLASAVIPVHQIGSCIVPDPDPTDERVMMPIRIELR